MRHQLQYSEGVCVHYYFISTWQLALIHNIRKSINTFGVIPYILCHIDRYIFSISGRKHSFSFYAPARVSCLQRVLFPLLTGMIRLWSFLQKICGTLSPVTCVAGSNLRIRIQTCSAGLLKSDEHFEEVAQRKMWANYVNQSFSSHLCEIVDIRCARQRGDDSVECLGDFFF